MNDINNLVIWLYLHGKAVIVGMLVITFVAVWQLMRLLYGRPIGPTLDRRHALIAGVSLLLLIALPMPVMSMMRPDVSTTSAIGRGLYQSQCRQCHGDRGNRLPGIALNSREHLASLGDAKLVSTIREGKGVMPAFGRAHEGPLDDEQVAMIVGYLKAVATSGGPGAAVKTAATPAAAAAGEGKDLYTKQCAACHGPTGSQLPNANLASPENLQAKAAGLAQVITEGKGGMPAFADKLSADQINLIVGFLRAQAGLTDATPAIGASGTPAAQPAALAGPAGTASAGKAPFEKNCQGCHGADGNLLPVAKLGSKDFLSQRQDAELLAVILDGKGAMPGFGPAKSGALTDAEARDVVAYLRSLAP